MSTTADRPADGVVVVQPARGYRYSADAFLLAGAALADGVPTTSLDLGTGCGVIPLLLARLGVRAVGVDSQLAWAAFWEASLAQSNMAPTLRVVRVQELRPGAFELVTCNPPYFPSGTGPVSPDALKAAAHTELDGGLADFVDAAARSCSDTGRVVFIVPSTRATELRGCFASAALHVWQQLDVGAKRSIVTGGRAERPFTHATLPARGEGVDALYARVQK